MGNDPFVKLNPRSATRCHRLANTLQAPIPAPYPKRCLAVAPPANAIENMVYTGILFRENYSRVSFYLDHIKPRLTFKSGAERTHFMNLAAILAHNAGPGRVHQLLQRLAQYHAERPNGVSLYQQFLYVVSKAGGEPSTYIYQIRKKARETEKAAGLRGGACSEL